MNRYTQSLSLLVVAAGMILIWTGTSSAIPAFSREHNTECTTCHTLFPELNEYGQAFLKNGFVWTKNKAQEMEAPKAAQPKKNGGNATTTSEIKGDGDPELLEKLKASAKGANGNDENDEALAEKVAPRKSEPLWLAGLLALLVRAELAKPGMHRMSARHADHSAFAMSGVGG